MDNELDVNDWISSAQEDLDGIALTSQVPLLANTCYHCGQAVEKMLKAYIIAKTNELTKTHDLVSLVTKCERSSPDFGKLKNTCAEISTFSTIRYPPKKDLTKQEMEETIKNTHEIVDFTMSKLKELGYDKTQQPTSDAMKKIMNAIRQVKNITGQG
jgi:HEPN domain-containing protein